MAGLGQTGRPAKEETAEEIIELQEAQKNYIPLSYRARREYAYVLLKEYRKYLRCRAEGKQR